MTPLRCFASSPQEGWQSQSRDAPRQDPHTHNAPHP